MKKAQMSRMMQRKWDSINELAAEQRRVLAVFATSFDGLPEQLDIWDSKYETTSWWSYMYGGSVTITLSELDSFKDAELFNLLEEVERYFGVELTSRDLPEYSQRKYETTTKWGDNKTLDISITAGLKFDAQGCQRVQVGSESRVVETPIYELRCSGE